MINSQNVAQTGSQAYVDQGLRQYMLKVYNYMAGGLCITALISYLIANTSAIKLFFTVAPNGDGEEKFDSRSVGNQTFLHRRP